MKPLPKSQWLLIGILSFLIIVAMLYWQFIYNSPEEESQPIIVTMESEPAEDNTQVKNEPEEAVEEPTNTEVTENEEPASTPEDETVFADPITDYTSRITKKPFGIFITPANSPVQPERFSGYHNAIDVEYGDIDGDVAVFAIADGEIVSSRTATGYGGVFVMRFSHEGSIYTALYGHIRPSALPAVGRQVSKGEQLAVLGTGFSAETDGERKHLHFAIHEGSAIDIRGYVQSQSELTSWVDPAVFLR